MRAVKADWWKDFYNGIDIEQFSRKEYISLFSNVFQDINLLHFTIGENITGSSDGKLGRGQKRC